MSRGRQKVSFEGLLQENVLGTFKIIRGFADLHDQHERFVHSYVFLPIAAEVYAFHSNVDPAKGANTEAERAWVEANRKLAEIWGEEESAKA